MTSTLRFRLVAVIILGTSGLAISAEVAASGNVQPSTALRIRSWVDDNVEKPLEPFELVPGKPASDWSFTLEPYGWLPAFDSNLAIKGFPAIGFRLSPIQVLQKLDWGIFMAGEARKGRWGVLADGMYAQFSAEGTTQGLLYQSYFVKFQQSIASLAQAFRVIDNKSGYLDLYAGGRAYYLGVDASAQPNRRLEDQLPRQIAKSQWWIDPIIGLRAQWNFTHWLYLNTKADVGGFGAGSQLAWFVQSAVGVNVTRNTSMEIGYRYLYFNYVGSQLSLESNLPGVYSGVIFRL